MNIILRPWKKEDAPALVEIANNFQIAKNLSDAFPHPYFLSDAQTFIEKVSHLSPCSSFAIEVDGCLAGSIACYLQEDVYRKNAEMGYFLAEQYHGKGIMPLAVKSLVKYMFLHVDLIRIYAKPFGSNLASQKVLEKAGFKLEARFEKILFKHGVFEDDLIYGIRREDCNLNYQETDINHIIL